ncbi:MAG: hypothetical protein LH606_05555 [Cytophagaceae bacterium]|nr:hypothetical protein [Cytophagaceae bacterium]
MMELPPDNPQISDPHTDTPDFQHGYTSGLEQVNKDSYEGYLSSRVNLERLNERIAENRQRLDRIAGEIATTRDRRKSAFDPLQGHLYEIGLAEKEVARLDKSIAINEEETQRLRDKRRRTESAYAFLAGLLYLVAGVLFVGGDLIISHEIVAYALNIRNNVEAWSFAVGLAMISILLKPAYERLIEQPYLENEMPNARRNYAWFIGGLVVFTIATMFVLGWFRYEAYKTDKLKQEINKTIRNIQSQQTDPASVGVVGQVDRELQKMDALNQTLVTSGWALLSFVLTGILFAIAGAVCLGVAFPILQSYWQRWIQIPIRMGKMRRERRRLTTNLVASDQRLALNGMKKAIFENELTTLPDPARLETEQQALRDELDELLKDSRFSEIDSRIAAFNDGYQKGDQTRQWMTEEEWNQFKNGHFDSPTLASRARSESGGSSSKDTARRNGSLKPHQALPIMIDPNPED